MQLKTQIFTNKRKKTMSSIKKLVLSAMVVAMYVVIMYFTQSFAFGQYQIRIATSLYALSGIYPFLIVPMGIANLISNTVMGGLGLLDMIGGAIVGMLASGIICLIKKYELNDCFTALPIVFVPGLLVPIWLSYLIHVPYKVLAISLCIGQIIPSIVGVLLLKQLRRVI